MGIPIVGLKIHVDVEVGVFLFGFLFLFFSRAFPLTYIHL